MKNYEIKSIITELFVFVIIEVRVLVNEDNGLRRKVKNKKNTWPKRQKNMYNEN